MIDSILKSDGEYEEYIIYHDESGVYKTDRYFFTGILYVKSNFQAEIITLLNRIRQEENYYREIHFKKIKGFTPKFNVAKKWLNLAERLLGTGKIYFTCQIVDTYHTNFDHTRFKKKFHAYNRLTAMAITSSIAWHLKRKETIHMQMVSDEKSRRPEGEIVKIDRDNFEDYIPSRINYDSIRHTFPKKLNFNSKVIVISSHGLEIKNQFLQLTDLILGAVRQNILPCSNKAKLSLAEIVYCWIKDICKKPWRQRKLLHKRFNCYMFPFELSLKSRLQISEIIEKKRGQLKLL